MDGNHVVIECRDCDLSKSVANLGQARIALDDHESETGHDVDWQIGRIDAGVERAGADAGVCGIAGCENPDSPLLDWQSDERVQRVDDQNNGQDSEQDGERRVTTDE